MMRKITLPEIIAYNNTPKAKALVVRYGYNSPVDHTELVETIFQFMKDYREEAVDELGKIHPDRDLILATSKRVEDKSNASGSCNCDSCKRKRYSNFEMADDYIDFDGSKNKENKSKMEEYLPIIAVAGIFALTIVSLNK